MHENLSYEYTRTKRFPFEQTLELTESIIFVSNFKGMSHDHHEEKPEGFLNTVFDSTMGGFGIVLSSTLLIVIFLLLLLG